MSRITEQGTTWLGTDFVIKSYQRRIYTYLRVRSYKNLTKNYQIYLRVNSNDSSS